MALNELALVTLIQGYNYLRVSRAFNLEVHAEWVGWGDGNTKAFTLDYSPLEGSLSLFVKGILQVEGTHFTIVDKAITFEDAPDAWFPITSDYLRVADKDTFESFDDALLENDIEAATKMAEEYTGRAFIQGSVTEQYTGDGTKILRLRKWPVVTVTSVRRHHSERLGIGDGETVAFTLNNTPITVSSIVVYKNGVLQTMGVDYTISGMIITFVIAPADGAPITANYKTTTSFTERLNIGRLYRDLTWIQDYIYEVVYTAGYASGREATQVLVPDVVQAVLLMMANLYENRVDRLKSESVSGVGSVTYGIESKARDLLDPYRVNVI